MSENMNKLIQWPRAKYWDRAWNPVIGCRPVSPACEHCWAREWARRFGKSFEPRAVRAKKPPRSGVVFCGNLTDIWGEWNLIHEDGGYFHNSCDLIASTLDCNITNPYKDKAVYLWLTKRTATMAEWVAEGGWVESRDYWTGEADGPEFAECDMSNQFFGFTAEDQEHFDSRMANISPLWPSWAKLWVSAEPLLGPISLGLRHVSAVFGVPFKWVVVGCESGPHRRPCKIEWVERVVEECMAAGVPVFVKQLDIGGRCVTDIERFPEHLRVRQVPWAGKDGGK